MRFCSLDCYILPAAADLGEIQDEEPWLLVRSHVVRPLLLVSSSSQLANFALIYATGSLRVHNFVPRTWRVFFFFLRRG